MKRLIFTFIFLFFASLGVALAGGIDTTYKWAWNDVMGWIEFRGNPPNDVNVVDDRLKNYGFFYSDQTSYIALDCQTTPNGDICTTSNFFVSNDGAGNLAGWAWNDMAGWISFCGNTSGGSTYNGSTWVCPASPTYQVVINPSTGDFSGWAWNEVIGWISFNCNNSGIGNTCATSNYKVNTLWQGAIPPVTGWLESSTFDTSIAGGAAFNSLMWQGTLGAGGTTLVKFHLATANCSNGATDPPTCGANIGWGGAKTSGDGAFVGSDGTSATYFQPSGPAVPSAIPTKDHNNKRYFRYKIFIEKDAGATSPTVQDVLINWSP